LSLPEVAHLSWTPARMRARMLSRTHAHTHTHTHTHAHTVLNFFVASFQIPFCVDVSRGFFSPSHCGSCFISSLQPLPLLSLSLFCSHPLLFQNPSSMSAPVLSLPRGYVSGFG
jgi:hypothetical protein